MFGFFKRRSKALPGGPWLDSIGFDTAGWEPQGEPKPGQVRVWFTPGGDGVGLYFFGVPPDLPQNARSAKDLEAFYAAGLQGSGGQLVEVKLFPLDGCPAVQMICKMPQQPSGMTYVGSLTIPFRGFSFVVKAQCEERSPTGLRESVLLDRRLGAGDLPELAEGRIQLPGWNPDDEAFDGEFPQHPLSRCRAILKRVSGCVAVAPGVKASPGFPLPGGAA
jgi:hypothetical protein